MRYVIVENKAKASRDRARALEHFDGSLGYDAERYAELLLRAVETLLVPAGVNAEMLQQWVAKALPPNHVRTRLAEKTRSVYWGPLFEFAERQKARVHAQTLPACSIPASSASSSAGSTVRGSKTTRPSSIRATIGGTF
jgi:hypothetical protein